MLRRLILTATILAALGLGGGGLASPATAATTSTSVRACNEGDSAESRSATFYGRMKLVRSSDVMRMRFTLYHRFGDGKERSVRIPDLRTWRNSKPGVRQFGYAQTVAGLEAGGQYRAKVEFRWLDEDGNLLRRSTRKTKVCKMPGDLADLAPLAITASPGPVSGTSVYQLTVTNTGKVAAADIAALLYVDGAATDLGHIDTLAAGEQKVLRFTGPTCRKRLRAVVDPSDSIHEESELDNTNIFRCP